MFSFKTEYAVSEFGGHPRKGNSKASVARWTKIPKQQKIKLNLLKENKE